MIINPKLLELGREKRNGSHRHIYENTKTTAVKKAMEFGKKVKDPANSRFITPSWIK